ncbi:MAG: Hsp20/alpha crystallin family protein [Gammaproteobacteria bacterium]|nr:Hsp20/alpha crystallin family protein [Gammaproteobacteria bacterium]MBV8405914.1 Hsp20/alpha crystallin family protein [Gammaproteobacteria bacterium]
MATQQNVTQDPEKDSAVRQATKRNESAMRPPVDVYETSDGIRLIADMPGVSKEHLRLQAEANTLTIEGDLVFEMAERMEALYADVRSTLYRCSFVLSSELDTSQIEAILKDGVLAVRIPKRAAFRPRRIEVQSG